MRFLPLIIALEIISSSLLLNVSTNSASASRVRHVIKSVLGTSIIAQDVQNTNTSSQDQTAPTPADTSNQPADTPAQPPDTSTPTPTDTPAADQLNTDQTNPSTVPAADQINVQQAPEGNPPSETPSESPSPTETPQPSEMPTTTEETSSQMQTVAAGNIVTNSEDLVSAPEGISSQAENKADQEDKSLENVTPQQESSLLINYASDKISDINANIKTNDYSTASFLTQRLNDQINQTQNIINTNSSAAPLAKQNLIKFCDKADLVLKTEQLAVPEELEQDIEIARAKCLNLQ